MTDRNEPLVVCDAANRFTHHGGHPKLATCINPRPVEASAPPKFCAGCGKPYPCPSDCPTGVLIERDASAPPLCQCGHLRSEHGIEPPYECCNSDICDCQSYTIPLRANAPARPKGPFESEQDENRQNLKYYADKAVAKREASAPPPCGDCNGSSKGPISAFGTQRDCWRCKGTGREASAPAAPPAAPERWTNLKLVEDFRKYLGDWIKSMDQVYAILQWIDARPEFAAVHDAELRELRAKFVRLLDSLIEEFENLTILGSKEKQAGYEAAMRTAVLHIKVAREKELEGRK